MNRLFFVCGVCVLLGVGCGSSPSAVSSTTTTPSSAVQKTPVIDVTVSDSSTTVVPTPSDTPEDSVSETLAVSMISGNFFFEPTVITASPGQNVSISFSENEGMHTIVIDEIGLKKTISSGSVVTFVAPTVPGSYAYYCDIGAHRKLGMEGVLIVK